LVDRESKTKIFFYGLKLATGIKFILDYR